MTRDEAASAATIATLRKEIAATLTRLDGCARMVDAAQRALPVADEIAVLGSAALAHAYYTLLEQLFERIAGLVDGDKPEGSTWHADLLARMVVDIPGVRPAVAAPALEAHLTDLLRFRHVFRSMYYEQIDPARLGVILQRITHLHEQVRASLLAFDGYLAAAAQRIVRSP